MQDKYQHQEIERAAHAHWNASDAYRVTEDASKQKFYACSMLPYPSGKLHMGHVIITDTSGKETKVEKTWVFRRGDDGKLRIVLHKSAIPYSPSAS